MAEGKKRIHGTKRRGGKMKIKKSDLIDAIIEVMKENAYEPEDVWWNGATMLAAFLENDGNEIQNIKKRIISNLSTDDNIEVV